MLLALRSPQTALSFTAHPELCVRLRAAVEARESEPWWAGSRSLDADGPWPCRRWLRHGISPFLTLFLLP